MFGDIERGQPYVLSMADLVQLTKYGEVDISGMNTEQVLYLAGMDVARGYEVSICEHRSQISNQLVTCERFVGRQRSDELWLNLLNRLKD